MNATLPALLIAALSGVSHAAVLGYTENFDTTALNDTVPAGWSEGGSAGTGNSTIVTNTGGRGYQFSISGSTNLYSSIPITDSANSSFSMSVKFMITAKAASPAAFSNINIIGLASSADVGSSGYRLGYNIGVTGVGTLNLSETGTGADMVALNSTGSITPALNVMYTMTLTGVYASGAYNLTATLTDGISTINVTATDTTARTGTVFGIRSASNSASNSQTVIYDDFSVLAVPEPATAGLAGIGLLGLLARRRSANRS